ncbi:MAG: hypothetical protein U1F43_01010 [Myxococcota bacterium]
MRTSSRPAALALAALSLAAVSLGASAADAAPARVPPTQRFAAGRVMLGANIGVGLPTGVLGASLAVDLGRFAYLEAGGGFAFGGGEAGLGVGGRVILEPGVAFDVAGYYSVDTRYQPLAWGGDASTETLEPAHFVNVLAGLEVRAQGGFDFRVRAGWATVIPTGPFGGTTVLVFGVTFGAWL